MVKLPGSVPAPLADARSIGPAPADERFEITVVLRRQPTPAGLAPVTPLALQGRLAARRLPHA